MQILSDFRYAVRAARRSPGVTLAIIVMLALGTGGVTAVFNPIYSTLFAPLPFPQSTQLVLIGGNIPLFNGFSNRFEKEEYLDRIFSSLTAYAPFEATSVTISDTGKSKQVFAVDVSEDFFDTLGVRPLRGSDFKHSELKQGFVVSNRFWRNELMGSENTIGKLIQAPLRFGPIIGVMPESFDFPAGADIWMCAGPGGALSSTARQYLGRLRPGVSHSKAAEEIKAIEFKEGVGLQGNAGPLLQSLQTVVYGDRRPILLMLGSTAVLFLLLVCAGVTNLLITQGARRKSEMAMCLILGATRRNLVFQLMRETLPLVIVGALAGLWLSEIASMWLMVQFPALKGGEVVIPVKMMFFATIVLAVTILGGLTPALYASSVDLNTYLKSGSDSKWRFKSISLRELLVGVQLCLALALLIGVGLLLNSMMFHVDIPIRWSSRDMAVVRAEFSSVPGLANSREAMTSRVLFFQDFLHSLNTMPEVVNAGIFRPIPFSAEAIRARHNHTGVSNAMSTDPKRVFVQVIEGYANPEGFEMLGVSFIAGRYFSSIDMANEIEHRIGFWERNADKSKPRTGIVGGTVIVNQSLARQFWPEGNAVGKIIYDGFSNSYEIIGVIRDFQQLSDNKDFVPTVYYPPDIWRISSQTFIVKLHSRVLMKDFKQRLSNLETGSLTIEVQSLGDIVSEAMANTRMTLQLLGSFALLGILVAGLGVYATTSLMATAWNREMGIRMAMGATTLDILKLALWRGIRAIFFGLPLGLFLAWILSRVLSSYLFQVKVGDPFVWIISCVLLLIITIIAAFIPALRVIRISPMDALRNE